jgi:hypothetical protein
MMDKLHIGVFGDSYADRNISAPLSKFKTDESWMAHIVSKGHKVSSYGLSGSASNHAFTCFKDHHHRFDHIVFCWSYVHRMQTMPQRYAPLSGFQDVETFYKTSTFKKFNAEEQSEIVQILLGYKFLCDFKFNYWVQQKMFDDVNQICKDKNIKLVNIFPFINNAGNELDFSNRHGDCLYNLYKVTEKEMDMGGYGDVRSTHLTDENNRILADIILDRFAEGKNILMDLFKDGDFIYSKDITQRYIDMGYDFQREVGMIKDL